MNKMMLNDINNILKTAFFTELYLYFIGIITTGELIEGQEPLLQNKVDKTSDIVPL